MDQEDELENGARLTRHAIERSKERIGLSPSATERLATRALASGIKPEDAGGNLSDYIDRLFRANRSAKNIRIYGQHVYIFAEDVLVTVFALPREHHRTVEKIKARRKRAEAAT